MIKLKPIFKDCKTLSYRMSLISLNRVLTSRGYAIKKTSLTDKQTQELRKELTMIPDILDKYQKGNTSFTIYYESPTRFYIPRHWGIKKYGDPEANIVSEGKDLPESVYLNSEFKPYDYQEEIINNFMNIGKNGIICAVCGMGKTVIALNIAIRLKKRVLIVVDKEFLMNQWKTEISKYIVGAQVGVLQGSVHEIGTKEVKGKEYTLLELKELAKNAGLKQSGKKNDIIERLEFANIDINPKKETVTYHITICMIQTLCGQEFPEEYFSDYGFTIFDECHHLGASYFSKALSKVQTKYMLGLSATPDRPDGLQRVFENYIGDYVIKQTQRAPDKEAIVKAIWFNSENDNYINCPTDWKGDIISAKLLNQIVNFEDRNIKIFNNIKEYIIDTNRYILILSDRISHLEWFENKCKEQYSDCNIGYYIGGMKQEKLDDNADKCKILLATYQMCSEAFSVKKLNTIVLTTPRKRVEQSTGRIFRERVNERKVAPHIIDIIDQHPCYQTKWYVRNKFYKECNYNIIYIDKPSKSTVKVEANEHGCIINFK